ncbi:MAG TPA: oligosaccharide flippase family protein [Candidatus Sulfotelmatobacter sp.]|jgi:PST family polysaccharide transporter
MTANAKRPSTLLRYGGFIASVGATRVLGIVITSITFPILVRRLGVEAYGQWSYIVALCAFLDVIANPGLTTYAIQQVAARRHAAVDLVSDFLALRVLAVLVATVVLLIIVHFEAGSNIRALLQWYGLAALCVGLTGSDLFLTSLELFHSRSLLTLMQQSLYAAGVLTFVHAPKDLFWVPISILTSAFLMNIAGWLVLWRNGFRPSLAIDPARWRGILRPAFHYAATTMMATIYHRTGHLVVRWFLGDYALGLYAAAIRFVVLLREFVGIPLGVLMPRMAHVAESGAGLRRLVNATVSALATVSIPLMLGTIATAHLVVPLVMGKSYAAAVGPVRLASGLLLAGPMASLLSGTVLYALGRYRAYLTAGATGAAAAIVLSLAFVRTLGVPGVCIAFMVAEAVVAITAYFLIPHELRDLWKNPMIRVAVLSGLIMVVGVHFANSYSSRPFVVVAAGALIYIAASALLGRKLLLQQFGGAR